MLEEAVVFPEARDSSLEAVCSLCSSVVVSL